MIASNREREGESECEREKVSCGEFKNRLAGKTQTVENQGEKSIEKMQNMGGKCCSCPSPPKPCHAHYPLVSLVSECGNFWLTNCFLVGRTFNLVKV